MFIMGAHDWQAHTLRTTAVEPPQPLRPTPTASIFPFARSGCAEPRVSNIQWQCCVIAGVTPARWTQLHVHAGQPSIPALEMSLIAPNVSTHALHVMHGTAAAVAVVCKEGCAPQMCMLSTSGGAASAQCHAVVLLQATSYGCTPKDYGSNCSLGCIWQKMCVYQRATVKRNLVRTCCRKMSSAYEEDFSQSNDLWCCVEEVTLH